jgi:quercetin dioxygenase-like cupin family protein
MPSIMRITFLRLLLFSMSVGMVGTFSPTQNPSAPLPQTKQGTQVSPPLIAPIPDKRLTYPPLDLHTDVLPSSVPQEVILVEHDFEIGESSGHHIHHGVELAYVMKGDLILYIAGRPPRRLHTGESFRVERDTTHEVRNVGTGPAALIITYLMDKGVPWKIPVGASAKPVDKP